MSKQYLTIHTVENAHPSPIFAVATTPDSILSASGGSSIRIHSASAPNDASLASEIPRAHAAGIHHLATAPGGPGKVVASAGFGDDVKVWVQQQQQQQQGDAKRKWELHCAVSPWGKIKPWAIALSADEQFLACSTEGGRVAVWDIVANKAVQMYETASASAAADAQGGTLGMSVDISADGRLTAAGLQNGTVHVFNNDSGRLVHTLNGLSKPIRATKFSPLGTRLATAGDAGIIAIYDTQNGEQVGDLSPPGPSTAWVTALDWSHTGEFLLAAYSDGRSRVWSVEAGSCVATHSEGPGVLWAARWLPKTGLVGAAGGETFCVAGESTNLSLYREATGGSGP